MDPEQVGIFAGRVVGAFLAMVVLSVIALVFVALAYLSAPTPHRAQPGTPTPPATVQ